MESPRSGMRPRRSYPGRTNGVFHVSHGDGPLGEGPSPWCCYFAANADVTDVAPAMSHVPFSEPCRYGCCSE